MRAGGGEGWVRVRDGPADLEAFVWWGVFVWDCWVRAAVLEVRWGLLTCADRSIRVSGSSWTLGHAHGVGLRSCACSL